jgi:chromosome segregation ATPase
MRNRMIKIKALLILIAVAPNISFAMCAEAGRTLSHLKSTREQLSSQWQNQNRASEAAQVQLKTLQDRHEGYPVAVQSTQRNLVTNANTIALLTDAMNYVEQSLVNTASLNIVLTDIIRESGENPDVPISQMIRRLARKNNSANPQIEQLANAVNELERKFADWRQTEIETLKEFSQGQDAGQILLELIHSGIERLESDIEQMTKAHSDVESLEKDISRNIDSQTQIIQAAETEKARLSAEAQKVDADISSEQENLNNICLAEENRPGRSARY